MIPGITASRVRAMAPSAPMGAGFIVSAVAGGVDWAISRSSIRTDLATWQTNFGETITEGLFASALVAPTYTGVLPVKVFERFATDRTYRLEALNRNFSDCIATMKLEFLSDADERVALIDIARAGSYDTALRYGVSESTLVRPATVGQPQVNGDISFTGTAIVFTKTPWDNNNHQSWSLPIDTSRIKKLRVSNVSANASYPYVSQAGAYACLRRLP